ncbi:MAG TPA: hypothetical protein PKE55_04185 [Kiritimatiellia bacterium]|nr:hypothetical protein [Kiritimatiellia bacterium]
MNVFWRVGVGCVVVVLLAGGGLSVRGEEERLGAPPPESVSPELREILRQTTLSMQERRLEDADLMLRQGLREFRGDPLLRLSFTTLLFERGDHVRAMRVLRDLIRERPGWSVPMNNLAWMLVTTSDPELRDPDEALALAQTALLLSPETYNIWNTLAEIYFELGDLDIALRMAVQAWTLANRYHAPVEVLAQYGHRIDRISLVKDALTLME